MVRCALDLQARDVQGDRAEHGLERVVRQPVGRPRHPQAPRPVAVGCCSAAWTSCAFVTSRGPQRRVGDGQRLVERQPGGAVHHGAHGAGDHVHDVGRVEVDVHHAHPDAALRCDLPVPGYGDSRTRGLVLELPAVLPGRAVEAQHAAEPVGRPEVLVGTGQGVAAAGVADDPAAGERHPDLRAGREAAQRRGVQHAAVPLQHPLHLHGARLCRGPRRPRERLSTAPPTCTRATVGAAARRAAAARVGRVHVRTTSATAQPRLAQRYSTSGRPPPP